jgi:hypothetical protein
MKTVIATLVATSFLTLNAEMSWAQQLTCKAFLDTCLSFVRPSSAAKDAADCRAIYQKALKTGRWEAPPKPSPCRAKAKGAS